MCELENNRFSFETSFENEYYGSKIDIFFIRTYDVACVTLCRSFQNGISASKCKNFDDIQEAIDFYNQIIRECISTENFDNISLKFD
jgi:hypothetical protein